MFSAILNAKAEIVNDGLTPNDVGIMHHLQHINRHMYLLMLHHHL